MKLLGLDPGLRRTGWGIIVAEDNRLGHLANGCVATEGGLGGLCVRDHLDLAFRDVGQSHCGFAELGVLLIEVVDAQGRVLHLVRAAPDLSGAVDVLKRLVRHDRLARARAQHVLAVEISVWLLHMIDDRQVVRRLGHLQKVVDEGAVEVSRRVAAVLLARDHV